MATTNSRKRKKKLTKQIALGDLKIGGKAPVVVQSMTKTDTRDVPSIISQIKRLEVAGCEVVRVAVLNAEAAQAIKLIKKQIKIAAPSREQPFLVAVGRDSCCQDGRVKNTEADLCMPRPR